MSPVMQMHGPSVQWVRYIHVNPCIQPLNETFSDYVTQLYKSVSALYIQRRIGLSVCQLQVLLEENSNSFFHHTYSPECQSAADTGSICGRIDYDTHIYSS